MLDDGVEFPWHQPDIFFFRFRDLFGHGRDVVMANVVEVVGASPDSIMDHHMGSLRVAAAIGNDEADCT